MDIVAKIGKENEPAIEFWRSHSIRISQGTRYKVAKAQPFLVEAQITLHAQHVEAKEAQIQIAIEEP